MKEERSWELCWIIPGGTIQTKKVVGGESVRECPVWQEFVRFNEIKLKKEK